MSAPNAHDVLRKLALLEAVGPDNPPEEILDELDRDLRNLQPGALDYALGDIPEDSVEENDTPLTLAASALGQPDAIDDELSPDLSVATLTRGAAARVWENWSKTYLARDLNFRSPRTAAELVRAVQEVVDASGTVKAIGAGYSCSSAAQPYKAGTVINTQDHLKRILPVIGLKDPQQAARLVRVEAGIRLDQLARELAKLELALPNLGGFDKQTLAGAMSTGTHGTGLDQSTFADAVASVDVVLVDSNGRAQLHRFEPTDGVTDPASYAQAKEFLHQNDDEFYGMVVSCGMTGIVYSYTLRVVELYFVRETNEAFVFPDDFPGVMARVKANENISISIHPNATLEGGKYRGLLNRFERLSKAQVNAINAGLWNNPPPRPTERNFLDYLEGLVGTKFIGWFMANNKKFVRGQIDKYLKESAGRSFTSVYYRVYPRPTGDRFVAVFNELSVPLDELESCTQQVLDHVRRNWDANDLLYQVPFALRFVGKSKHFLSMHYARDSATIEAFCLLGSRRPSATLTALERLLPQARPHWGQLHALLTPVSDQYPSSWGHWLKQYKRANVSGVFNSPMTKALGITQPRPHPATDTQLRSVAQSVSAALNNQAIEGDIDEHYPGLAELLSDEDVRADLLPHLRAGQSRQLSTRRDTFQNWLGEGGISVADIIDDADSLDDLRARLSSTLNPVRVCGKRHSDNLVARPDPGSLVVDLSNWRIKRSAGIVSETLCQRLDASKIVSVPYEKHEAQGKRYVRMFAWETLQDIADRGSKASNGDPLERFALFNTGSFTHQTLAGPLSVGTHGSGAGLGAMCDQVGAIDILGLDGIVRRVSKIGTNFPLTEVVLPDGRGRYTPLPSSADFNASVVNLGTLGVVLAYWVEVDQFYWLKQSVETRPLEEALNWVEQDLSDPNSKWRHVEILLMPERAPDEYRCALIRREKCGENSGQKGPPKLPPIVQRMRCNPEATRANATTLSRVRLARQTMYKEALEFQMEGNGDAGPWSQVLVRNTGVPAHGFEIAVPAFLARKAVHGVLEGIAEAGQGFGKQRGKPTSPIGVRFVRASEQYLAMSYREFEFQGRTWQADVWCFIEVPRLWGTLAQALIPEKIVERLKLIGVFFRLHWGQYAPFGSRDAAREYPKLRKWLGSRVTFGASARLLTAELCRVFGLPAPPAFAIGSRSLAAVQVESSMTAIHVEDVGAAVQVESSITAVQIESSDATLSPAVSLDPSPTVPALPSAPRSERPLVLCVHGIGDHRSGQWHQDWQEALTRSLKADGIAAPRFVFVGLDDLFQADELNLGELSDAAISFANSWLRYRGRREAGRGLLDEAGYWLEWIPGMIAKWAGDPLLRDMLRARVADAIQGHKPTFICAHSLGSLVCYDALSHADSKSCTDYQSANNPVHFVSLGSQIGHPSVRFVWGGRLVMPAVSTWTHLYNPHDAIFTAPVKINDNRFSQWDVTDIQGGVIDQHAAANYLGHAPLIRVALAPLFHALGSSAASEEDIGNQVRTQNAVHFSIALRNEATKQQGKQRALLVGINRHADPSWNLEGCVNDVYRMSEILQTRFGYEADNIRLLIDERATAVNIRERMEWLLDGADDEAQRLFYYSGHGARIPGYNALEVIDQQDEVLVPHDFSWTDPSTALVDDEFLDLYAQLPYAARFAAVFDCCHAGGMSRSGGTNVRGLTPPDDIRHRLMKFEGGVWRSRAGWEEKSAAVREPLAYSSNRPTMRRSFLGACRTLRPSRDQFIEARNIRGHQGPYMPILLYACNEAQLAFEHRAGTKTHGAFTYALAELLERSEPGQLTFHDLIRSVTAEVHQLGYHQAPTIEGPSAALSLPFSF